MYVHTDTVQYFSSTHTWLYWFHDMKCRLVVGHQGDLVASVHKWKKNSQVILLLLPVLGPLLPAEDGRIQDWDVGVGSTKL